MTSNNSKRFAILALLGVLIIVAFVYYWITRSVDEPQPSDNFVDQFPSSGDGSVGPGDNNDVPGFISRDDIEQTSSSSDDTNSGTSSAPVYDYSFDPEPISSDEWRDDIEGYSVDSFFVNNGSDEVGSIVQRNNGGADVYDQAAQDISFQQSVSSYEEANNQISEGLAEYKRDFQDNYNELMDERLRDYYATVGSASASSADPIDISQFLSQPAPLTGLANSKNCGSAPNRNDLDKDLESLAIQIQDPVYACVGKAIVDDCDSVLTQNESGSEYIAYVEGIGCAYGITFNDVGSDVDYAYFCPFSINKAIVAYAEDLEIDNSATKALEVMMDSLEDNSSDGFISDIDLYTTTNESSAQGIFNYSTRQLNDEAYALIARMVVPDTTKCQTFDH